MMPRHLGRIMLVVTGCALYLPAMALLIIRSVGPFELQALFDWFAGRCGGGCGNQSPWATLTQIVPIAVTFPVLAWIGIIWVIRGRRSDRQVAIIAAHFEQAPERVSPHAIDAEEEDRYLYRDRQGRLRPVYVPPSPSP